MVVCDLWRENMTGGDQTGSWWCRRATVVTRPRSSKRFQHLDGQCGNLINALKLLANQHEDGDGLVHNIVTNLCEVSRKGLTKGLRNFIQVDNHRALEVGHLREGLGPFKVRGPKGQEGVPSGACQGKPRRINARSR